MNFLGTKSLLTIVAALVFFTLTIFFIAALFAAVKPTFVKDDTPFLWFGLWKVVAFSLKQALCSTGISLILGIAVAFYTSNRNFPGSSFLLSFSAIPLCVPPLLVALGFVMFFGMGGWLNKTLMSIFSLSEPPLSFLYSLGDKINYLITSSYKSKAKVICVGNIVLGGVGKTPIVIKLIELLLKNNVKVGV